MKSRMSWSEAEAVVRAFRAERGGSTDVDVATLAATLGTTEAEIHRLARKRRRFTDGSGVLSAALAFGVVALGGMIALGSSLLAPRPTVVTRIEVPNAPIPTPDLKVNGDLRIFDATPDALGYWTPDGKTIHLRVLTDDTM